MAREVGECGATTKVKALLRSAGITIASLDDCEGAEAALEQRLDRLVNDAEAALEARLGEMQRALDGRQEQRRHAARQAKARVATRRAAAKKTRDDALRASFLGGIKLQLASYGHHLLGEADAIVQGQVETVSRLRMAGEQRRIDQLRAAPEAWLEGERARAAGSLAALRAAVEGDDFRGAVGEEIIAHRLRALDDGHWVLHDLTLRPGRPVTLFGHRRLEAQVDHAVVGPGGVFVIETKRWSRATAQRPDIRDPYEQAATAAQFVRITLRQQGHDVPVRALVAACGHLPPKRSDAWASVVRPDTIARRIAGAEPRLALPEVEGIARTLRPWCR
jgi:hypothetical protein